MDTINNRTGQNGQYSVIGRKIFHLMTILYVLGYNYWPRPVTLAIAGSLIIIDIIVESLRLTFPKLNDILVKPFRGTIKEEELNNVSTLIWTFTGAFLTMFIFQDKKIVTVSLLYMVFGDSIAGLVGITQGRTKIGGSHKSFEGSLACFIICFICGIFFLPYQLALIGACIATVVELLPLPLNDNFWLPIFSGFALTFLSKFFLP